MRTIVSLSVTVFALTLFAGCSDKPSCKLLYKRYKDCEKEKSKKADVSESTFVELCEKMKDKEGGFIQDEIDCSKNKDCDKFKSCVKDKRKARRGERLKKRWAEAMEKAKKGDYDRALAFCRYQKDDLTDDLKKECEGLPKKAFDALLKDYTAKRDQGKTDYKEVNCYSLKRLGKEAGGDKEKVADTLCKEIDLVRNVTRTKKDIEKQLTASSPYPPYNCWEKQLEKVDEIGTPFAKKLKAELIELCFKKLGKVILQKKVPTMSSYCSVEKTYKGIKKYGIKDPDIDKLMEDAKKACEK